MKIITDIKEFFLCMLKDKCEFSIKKFLVYAFTVLAIYLAVFTTKDSMFYQTLFMIGALLALRSYDKTVSVENKNEEKE
jgi:hypothetical protein